MLFHHLGQFREAVRGRVANISRLLQDANTAFGKQCITYYDLFILVKQKLCREIRFEFDSILGDEDSTQLACDGDFVDDTVSKAWLRYSRRPTGYYDGILQLLDPDHPKQAQALPLPSTLLCTLPLTTLCQTRHWYARDSTKMDLPVGDRFYFQPLTNSDLSTSGTSKNLPKSYPKAPRAETPTRRYTTLRC